MTHDATLAEVRLPPPFVVMMMTSTTLGAPRAVARRSAARSGTVCAALKSIGVSCCRACLAIQPELNSTHLPRRGEHAGAEAEGCAAPAATEGCCTEASVTYRGAAPAQQGGGGRPPQLGCVQKPSTPAYGGAVACGSPLGV
jgi:hypothetical protein